MMTRNESGEQDFSQKIVKWFKESITVKLAIIGVLILLLQIPNFMVENLIRDRKNENAHVEREISEKWGREQDVVGPVLSVPYYTKGTAKRYVHILPERLNIVGDVNVEMKYRGIYQTPIYSAPLNYTGFFDLREVKKAYALSDSLNWSNAVFSIGVPDMRGIQERVIIRTQGKNVELNPGLVTKDLFESGISNNVMISPQQNTLSFNFKLALNGSNRLAFYPIGKETNVDLKSNWENPSFNGAFLPDKRVISSEGDSVKGFVANWKVLNLNRNYPQFWKGKAHRVYDSDFGTEFKVLADHYQKTTRSSKYANMFIFLTFLIFFFIEVIIKVRIHPIQYLLVGIGLIVFYTLLLSISEHYNFQVAYIISGTAVVALITSYIHMVFKKWKPTMVLGTCLVGLYTFLFVTLQLETYSLLIGSIGIFLILAAVMFASRKVKWMKPPQPIVT